MKVRDNFAEPGDQAGEVPPRSSHRAGSSQQYTRRQVVMGAAAWGLAACRRSTPAPPSQPRFDGFPIHRMESLLTPTAEFFVRDHFGVPPGAASSSASWAVRVEGAVEHPLELALPALTSFPEVEQQVTLECAGNAGRNGLGAPGAGRAWGGASTASFRGYPLSALLRPAGIRAEAVELVFEGADSGTERGSAEVHSFARSLPLGAALDPSAMLVTGMNGAPLPALHGGPLRAVFPGRYATDSVKWVKRIIAVTEPFLGYYQASRYRRAIPGNPGGEPLGPLRVQSEIAHPKADDRLPLGLMVDVVGVAWGGLGGATRVQVSVDGGRTFAEATFIDPPHPARWRRWTWSWKPDLPGPRLLLARATDGAGRSQPFASDEEAGLSTSLSGPDRIQYANNSVPVIPVLVV